jgi:hypothetical protein
VVREDTAFKEFFLDLPSATALIAPALNNIEIALCKCEIFAHRIKADNKKRKFSY